MQKSTTSKQEELHTIQNSVEETHKENSNLSEKEPIENTPFWLITTEIGSFIVLGEYRISEIKRTKAEALDELRNNDWYIILHVVAVVVEKTLQEKDRVLPNKTKQ